MLQYSNTYNTCACVQYLVQCAYNTDLSVLSVNVKAVPLLKQVSRNLYANVNMLYRKLIARPETTSLYPYLSVYCAV